MTELRFNTFDDQELDDIAQAFQASSVEMEHRNERLVSEVAEEFRKRKLTVTGVYSRRPLTPDEWERALNNG